MWLVALFIGSLLLSLIWFWERTTDLNFLFWITKMLPVLIACEMFYWYGFRNAPSFLIARYSMSAMTHVLGILLVVVFLKEGIHLKQIFGILFIVLGLWVLK